MGRRGKSYDRPTIEDDKVNYFKEQLARELSHMFMWENLPSTIPKDYLERNLIRHGSVLFYEDENIGHDILRCEVTGFNRHDRPILARAHTYSQVPGESGVTERNLRYLSDGKNAIEEFDRFKDGVLIRNMERGQTAWEIIEHFAERLALAQQAFDTNLLYANMPYIFKVSSSDTKLSILKMWDDIYTGKPLTIVDKDLFTDQDSVGTSTDIQFIAKEIYDVKNEIKMEFRQTVGIDTAGVEKAERVNTLEIESNEQHTQTVLQVMKEQRDIAVEAINSFFDCDIKVTVRGEPITSDSEEVDDYGDSDSGTEEFTED